MKGLVRASCWQEGVSLSVSWREVDWVSRALASYWGTFFYHVNHCGKSGIKFFFFSPKQRLKSWGFLAYGITKNPAFKNAMGFCPGVLTGAAQNFLIQALKQSPSLSSTSWQDFQHSDACPGNCLWLENLPCLFTWYVPIFTASVVEWLLALTNSSAFLMPDKIMWHCVAELLTLASRHCNSFCTGKLSQVKRLLRWLSRCHFSKVVICPGVFRL